MISSFSVTRFTHLTVGHYHTLEGEGVKEAEPSVLGWGFMLCISLRFLIGVDAVRLGNMLEKPRDEHTNSKEQ